MNRSRFEKKIALVVGGTDGMGLVVGRALCREGATVILSGRNASRGTEAAADLLREGGSAEFRRCDVKSAEDVEELVAQISRAHGRLDCAFNNAGITASHAPVGESSIENWRDVIDVNLTGIYHALRAELHVMSRAAGGAIVNNSSLAGLVPIAGQAAYVASKYGVIGLTQTAAMEYAQERDGRSAVRVNSVAPGPILGGMNSEVNLASHPERTQRKLGWTAARRFGRPEEVAAAVLWLLSDEASYVTGAVLPVDGGAAAGKC